MKIRRHSERKSNLIKTMIFIMAAFFVLGGIVYLAWLNHDDFKRVMIQEAESQLSIIAESEAQSIEKYIGEVQEELESLSGDYAVRRAISAGVGLGQQADFKPLLNNSYRDVERIVDAIFLLDANGIVKDVAPSGLELIGSDLSGQPDVRGLFARRRPYSSEIFNSHTGNKVISVLYPVFAEGRLIGGLRAFISIERVNDLLMHINKGKHVYSFLIDRKCSFISYPNKNYIGQNVAVILSQTSSDYNKTEFRHIISNMSKGNKGTAILDFLAQDDSTKTVKTIMVFAPIRFGTELWSIAVAMDYDAISHPINRNMRDNIFFMLFVLMVFVFLGYIYFREQRRRSELSVSARALGIINKQLHLEIDERKRIQRSLQDSLDRQHRKKEEHHEKKENA
ncbi:MAG: cache domain-containing protein [Candidatus Omnitrophica bacterium]|nr:cache domain-containing protein [Candidatus Omnitrophota bacterium]